MKAPMHKYPQHCGELQENQFNKPKRLDPITIIKDLVELADELGLYFVQVKNAKYYLENGNTEKNKD